MTEQKIDYLREDPPLHNQDWCVISFVNPKDKVTEKNIFYINNFFMADVNKQIEATSMHVVKKANAELTNRLKDKMDMLKSSVNEDDKVVYQILNTAFKGILLNENEFIDECTRKYKLNQEELMDRYKVYLTENRSQLDREFESVFGDATSVRGVKFRGSFASYKDAERHAKNMREFEPGHNVYVMPTGKWGPIDFEADEVQNQDYLNDQLNTLMGKYHENIHQRNQFYAERKREMLDDAQNKNKMTTKQRLQEKLRQKRNEKIRQEIADARSANEGNPGPLA